MELIDEILNVILFVLIGMEILLISFAGSYLIAGLLAIPLVLLARWISIGAPLSLLRLRYEVNPGELTILTWGGLRGGISVALALSLPPGDGKEIILAITYVVVVFSIIVQGLTIKKVIKRNAA